MALRGNLRDFSLPDVFQLVQLSGKTGVLRIVAPDAEGSIWFRDGEVFFAQSNWRREQLGERLVAAQRITPAALARALELRASEPEGGRRLGEILVNEGYITPQVLETFVQEQIQDTIFDLMRWDEGDFDFEVLPDVVHEDIGLSVSVENIVMEGSRRLEEWQRIKKKVPSTEMVFKMATAPGEGTFEISLKPVEWALLLLIDGTRSVRELAVETHSTDFDVARVIYGLFSAGLLEVPVDDEIERLRADRSRREERRAKVEAERAALEEQQAGDTPGLEARQQTEATEEAELAAEPEPEPEPAAEPEPEAEPSAAAEEPKHIPEEPEFLATSGEVPSADDMAVFEQMMASVLSPQAPQEAEEAAVEPAVGAEPGEVPPYEALAEFAPEYATEPEAEPEFEPEFVPAFEPASELGLGLEPETETGTEAEAPGDLIPGLDFIPEVPVAPAFEEPGVDLETPYVPYAPSVEPEPEFEAEPEMPAFAPEIPAGIDLASLTIAELEALSAGEILQPEAPKTGDFEVDLRSLGLGEYPEELLQSESAPAEDMLAPAEDMPAPPAEVQVPMSEVEAGRDDSDLDSLLASLGGGTPEPQGIISSGTDYGDEPEDTGGYISTDAFLAEFDDSALSGGLGDELTALTGGGAVARSQRPVATVAHIPEVGEAHMLHRDQMVDRALLEKIIEGIENL